MGKFASQPTGFWEVPSLKLEGWKADLSSSCVVGYYDYKRALISEFLEAQIQTKLASSDWLSHIKGILSRRAVNEPLRVKLYERVACRR